MKFTTIAAKDFFLAPDCRTTLKIKKGDSVEVDSSSVSGMIAAGQIKEPKNFAEMLEGAMTTKTIDNEPDDDTINDDGIDFLERMDKVGLEEYAKEMFDVDLDRRRSKQSLITEIRSLISPSSNDMALR